MLSTKQMIKIDPSLAELSEEELEKLRADTYGIVELAFEVWLHQKNGSKNPVGSFTSHVEDGTV